MKHLALPTLFLSMLVAAETKRVGIVRGTATTAPKAAINADVLSGPILGYSLMPAQREARLIQGIPGSVHYSGSFAWPETAESVRTTPGHHWLLALGRDGGCASAWVPEHGVEHPLPVVNGKPSVTAYSPYGGAVAFYWRESNRLVVYAGLPDAPVLAVEISHPSWRGTAWSGLAVSGDARLVVGLAESGELRLLVKDGEPAETLLREASPVASYGFFTGDNELVVAEALSDRVEWITDVRANLLGRRFAQIPAAASPSVRFIPGGRGWFSLVNPDGAALYRIEEDGSVRTLVLDRPIQEIESLRFNGTTLLQAREGERSIMLMHAAGEESFAVPAMISAMPEGEQQ